MLSLHNFIDFKLDQILDASNQIKSKLKLFYYFEIIICWQIAKFSVTLSGFFCHLFSGIGYFYKILTKNGKTNYVSVNNKNKKQIVKLLLQNWSSAKLPAQRNKQKIVIYYQSRSHRNLQVLLKVCIHCWIVLRYNLG